MKIRSNKNLLGLLFIIIVFIVLHIPTIQTPYHYDAIIWVAQSKYLMQNGPFAIPPEDYGHPYFMFWTLALFYKLFGETVIISHTIMLFFSIITIIGTYLIGKELFNEKIGLLAAAFLSFQPWFFIVSSWVFLDVPMAAMFTTSIYFFIKAIKTGKTKFYWFFALFGSLATISKEPGALTTLIPFSYFLIKREFKREFLITIIPVITFIAWYAWYFFATGNVFHPVYETLILIPINSENIFLTAKNYTTNAFFNFIQNGNFIIFLLITYVIFYRKYSKAYLAIAILFVLFAPYSFRLIEPDIKFYPFLLLFDILFIFWVIRIPQIKDEYKILVIWIAVIFLHSFFKIISFKYAMPMLPAFATLFAFSITKIRRGNIVLLIVFSLLSLQLFNYSNYYSQRDLIYENVFNYFSDKNPQNVMVAYPLASPALIAVEEIDSKPWGNINITLTPKTKEEFDGINPQYLVIDQRTVEFKLDYIQDIMKTRSPDAVYTKEINWITYYGIRKTFINTLSIYKFY